MKGLGNKTLDDDDDDERKNNYLSLHEINLIWTHHHHHFHEMHIKSLKAAVSSEKASKKTLIKSITLNSCIALFPARARFCRKKLHASNIK